MYKASACIVGFLAERLTDFLQTDLRILTVRFSCTVVRSPANPEIRERIMNNRHEARPQGVEGVAEAAAVMAYMKQSTQQPARSAEAVLPHGIVGGWRNVPVLQASCGVGFSRPSSPAEGLCNTVTAKRARKDRGPNWQMGEIMALIEAKRELFFEELKALDGRDLMNPESTKWARISVHVAQAGFSPYHRDGAACKSKWNQLIPEYKRIADFHAKTGTNIAEYWTKNAVVRRTEGLPRSFSEEVFYGIHQWYGSRPSMQPPHTRDLLSPQDRNYEPPSATTEEQSDSDRETEDAMDVASAQEVSAGHTSSSFSPAPVPTHIRFADILGKKPMWKPMSRPKTPLPAGVSAQVLSSSDTGDDAVHCQPGNTSVRRKSLSGHMQIAQATKATGEAMTTQMKDMAVASNEIERSKIDIQLRLFSEQMEFQRQRDRRLQENAEAANDNAKLAIIKQGEVVQCLANLAAVLSAGLQRPNATVRDDGPQKGAANYVQEVVGMGTGPPSFPATTPISTDCGETSEAAAP